MIKATLARIPLLGKLSLDPSLQVLWRCYLYLKPYTRIVTSAYLTVLLINGLNLIIPQLIGRLIDDGIGRDDLTLVGWAIAGILALSAIKGLFTYFQQRWLEVGSQNVAYDMRNDLQTKLTDLSFSFHDRSEAGQLLSRAIQDVERIRFLTGRATWRIVDGIILLISTGAVMMWMNPQLAILILITMPILVHRGFYYANLARPLAAQVQDQLGALTSELEQGLRGMRVVKGFAREPAMVEQFDRENESWFKLSAFASRVEAVHVPLMDLIVNSGTVIILLYGGWLVINRQITIGELVAFTTYLAQLASPVRTMGRVIPAIIMAAAAGERIFAVLDAEPEVRDAPNAVTLPPLRGHVSFENVSLAYTGRRPAVRNITFEALPGQMIALLGATGAGKSTLTHLISRFYDPTEGAIKIDGYDLRTATRASVRRQIGVVLQETTLFAATIRENIAFGRPTASEEEIIAAARAAQSHDFIMQMPQGYDTPVGERGVTLSGGQKQRLAIARAILTNPRVLILDDATASVDSETEQLIQVALEGLMQNRTTFVIAHRLSTMRKADMILIMDKGRIVARGTHDNLIQSSPLYADIYQRQQRATEAEENGE
jgi:ATP-binding cassette subfamily B protein